MGGSIDTGTEQTVRLIFEGLLLKKEEEILNGLSIGEQASVCFDRVRAVLPAGGLYLTNVMKVEMQLPNPDSTDIVDDVSQDRFDGDHPQRTTIGVCSLLGDGAVQFDVIAAEAQREDR